MSIPGGMVAGQIINESDVRHIYESLTSASQDIVIRNIFLNNFSTSGNSFEHYSLNILDSSVSIPKLTNYADINDVFLSHGLSPSSDYHGLLKTLSWVDIYSRTQQGTAICMKNGASTYKWVEISRSFV